MDELAKTQLKTTIESEQDATYAVAGKYKYIPKGEKATDVEVHEYVTTEGEAGYIIYEYKEVDKINYKKATGKGTEIHRYHDWGEQVAPGK